jgi:hypothetical protein
MAAKAVKRETAAGPRRAGGPATWAAVILAVLVITFFHEVVVGGKTFVSPDTTAPAGFVRVGEQSLFGDRVYPLWNPYVFLGMPSFASGTYNPLIYPPDWPVWLVQRTLPLPELTWMLLYYFVAGFGMFALAREWGARAEGALLAAVGFVFAPNLIAVGSHGHGSQLVNSAYIPVMLWLAARWLRGGGLSYVAALALAGGFQMLRGHVQICFYTWLAVGLYAGIECLGVLREPRRLGDRLARTAAVLAAAAVAFGIAGFYNLPLRDYARWSIRGGSEGGGVGMDYATSWSLAPYELPTVVVPSWTGFGGQTYWGGMPFTDYPNAFVGIVAVLLALPAFLGGGVPRAFALVLAVLSILVSFGKYFPLYGFLYDHLPLFNKFRIPVMIVVLFQVAAALGLAWGWSALVEKPRARGPLAPVDRILLAAGGVLAVLLVVALLAPDAGRAAYTSNVIARASRPGQPYPQALAGMAYDAFRGDLVRACLLGLVAAGLAWFARGRQIPVAVATGAALVLLCVELWPVSGRVMQTALGDRVQRNLDLGRDDVVDFLEKAGPPGTFRILPTEEFQNNRYSGFAIASAGGYHAAKPRLAQDMIEAGLLNSPQWLRLLNIRYLVLPQPIEAPPGLRLAHQGSAYVYENLFALPRATVVGAYRVVSPARAILDSVASGVTDPAAVTFLAEDPGLALGPVEGATASIRSYRLNDVTVDVTTPGPALVRLADLWYPDWTAEVAGRPVPVLRADYLLRAVPVPAGSHSVVFRFRSPAIRHGLQLSFASLALVLLVFAADFALRRRRTAPAAGA